jgi:outer membrane protein TolC
MNNKEELIKITPDLIAKIPNPQRTGDREDLKAVLKVVEITALTAELAIGKHDPAVDLFASGTMNGRKDNYAAPFKDSQKGQHNTFAVGVKINAPIGAGTLRDLRAGYAKDQEAASLTASRKRFENDREWDDLNRKLQESKSRLTLTQRIEDTQKRKLDAERDRQSKGRSTMFQVMQAETDYATSQLNVIRNKAEILGIIARMKTFGGEG